MRRHTLKGNYTHTHTDIWSLGKIPCCHRNSWWLFFPSVCQRNSDAFYRISLTLSLVWKTTTTLIIIISLLSLLMLFTIHTNSSMYHKTCLFTVSQQAEHSYLFTLVSFKAAYTIGSLWGKTRQTLQASTVHEGLSVGGGGDMKILTTSVMDTVNFPKK